jgi:5-methylcytosine-specific restriction endonuclease McrA
MKRLSPYKWLKRKKECFERDDYKCQDCNSPFVLDAHHIIRRSRGGSDDLDNLVTLCRICHSRRHTEHQVRWTPGLKEAREAAAKGFNAVMDKGK